MSTILDNSTRNLLYSAFSYYASRRGGELPGPWIVTALGTLGRSVSSVRQCLYRMEYEHEVVSRKVGRVKYYRLTETAQQILAASLSSLFGDPDSDWDGRWTIVRLVFDGEKRLDRDNLRVILEFEGFAQVGSGVFVHPRHRSDRILKAASSLAMEECVLIFRGDRIGSMADSDFVRRYWTLSEIKEGYQDYVRRFQPLLEQDMNSWTTHRMFETRFEVVLDFLKASLTDPDLPPALLSRDWPGKRAQTIAVKFYERLLPGALAFGDEIMDDLNLPEPFPPPLNDIDWKKK